MKQNHGLAIPGQKWNPGARKRTPQQQYAADMQQRANLPLWVSPEYALQIARGDRAVARQAWRRRFASWWLPSLRLLAVLVVLLIAACVIWWIGSKVAHAASTVGEAHAAELNQAMGE